MKKILISLVCGLAFALSLCAYASKVQNNISQNLIRLHVVANSNSEYDQKVKLIVRDKVNEYLAPILKNSKSVRESEKIISENLETIQKIANQTLKNENAPYLAKASLGVRSFPTKQYENLTLPAGNYNALCIDLGNASGKNWWCVMFPPLCINNSTASIDDTAKNYLKQHLDSDSFSLITSDNDNFPVVYRFKIFDCLNSIGKNFKNH